ncbi:hypothetical protein [Priestia aryabhattai]|nr:hypothetical protein [Priestia aryabhattai]
MDKETAKFILETIEALSWAIITGDHDPRQLHEIHQQAGSLLFELESSE